MIEVKITSRMIVIKAKRLARAILPSPMRLPVRAEAVYDIPNGNMKIKLIILIITTSAASALTLMSPVKIARSSKAHHSKQSMSIPDTPILI